MIKWISILCFILLNLSFESTNEEISQNGKLFATAKIWGFLKYYHPRVAKGKFDWDDQLFQILPKVNKAKSKEELSIVFVDWINSLGEIKKCKSCDDKEGIEYFNKNFDLSWIHNGTLFSTELNNKLKFIEENRFQGKHYYVSTNNNGNIQVINEKQYKDAYPFDKNYSLLTLFRYWNLIEYYFPYKYLTDQDWDDVLVEMIPLFLESKGEEFEIALLKLIAKTDDSHARILVNRPKMYHVPAIFRIIENKAIITDFYNDSLATVNDLKIGDIITHINGNSIDELSQERLELISASLMQQKFRNAYYDVIHGKERFVDLTIERLDDSTDVKTVERYDFKEFNYYNNLKGKKWRILENGIGFVDMGILGGKDVNGMMDQLMECEVIIFDLRNYPKFIYQRISKFLNSNKKEFVHFIKPDINYPGRFIWKKSISSGEKNNDNYKGKVILLVDERTQSRAEYTCMSFQTADDVITIGSQTAGTDGDVTQFELINGFRTSISGLGVFYPDGTQTQRKGIKVDVEIKPSLEGIVQRRDEVLEKAIQLVR